MCEVEQGRDETNGKSGGILLVGRESVIVLSRWHPFHSDAWEFSGRMIGGLSQAAEVEDGFNAEVVDRLVVGLVDGFE